jgi:hypothetical protein
MWPQHPPRFQVAEELESIRDSGPALRSHLHDSSPCAPAVGFARQASARRARLSAAVGGGEFRVFVGVGSAAAVAANGCNASRSGPKMSVDRPELSFKNWDVANLV